jgi:hypothetical protein
MISMKKIKKFGSAAFLSLLALLLFAKEAFADLSPVGRYYGQSANPFLEIFKPRYLATSLIILVLIIIAFYILFRIRKIK